METTPNYNLKKPSYDEFADVEALNQNADIVDAKLKELEDEVKNDEKLTELERKLTTHLDEDALIKHKARQISVVNPETQDIQDVQAFAEMLFTSVSNGKQLIGTAITDADDSLVVPTNPTFQNLADLIGSINTGKKWASGTATPMSTTKLFKTTSNDVNSYFIEIRNLEFEPSFIVAFDYSEYNSAYPTVYAKGGIVSFQGKIGHAVCNSVRYVYGGNMSFLNGTFTLPIELSTGSRQWIAFE